MRKFLTLVLPSFLFCPCFVLASDERGVSVRGECQAEVPIDRGSILLIVKQRNQNPGLAAQQTQEKFNRVSAKVRKLNLKDMKLKTQSFHVTEDFEYQNGKQISKGHLASQALEVETSDPGKLSEVLKLSSEEKIEEVGQLQTFSSFTATQKSRESCLESAFRDAKDKAERLAKASGQRLGKVLRVTEVLESAGSPSRPVFAKSMMMAEVASGSGGEIHTRPAEVRVAVDAQFELK